MILYQNKDVNIFSINAKAKKVPFLLVNDGHEEAELLFETLLSLTGKGFVLITINTENWNDDLSPWPADPVFRNTPGFGGKADAHLDKILKEILPTCEDVLKQQDIHPSWYGLAGYSLAGLFALYAGYCSDRFQRIASVSGSLWYPSFLDFCRKEKLSESVDYVYLSLGDAEARTKNPFLSKVESCTEEMEEILRPSTEVFYELNKGDHFFEPTYRLAKGIASLLNK